MMGRRFFHGWRHRRHHHHIRVILILGGVAVELIPDGVIHMSALQDVGQTTSFSIEYLDQNGSLMLVPQSPDAAPAWSQTNAAVELLVAAADGNTASAKGLVAGSDTVKVDLKVSGVSFSATIDMTVNAGFGAGTGSQTLTSINIRAASPV
jgi:hypothetical protein